jgi:hypothetical protein
MKRKAILIDSTNQTVTEVEVEKDTFKEHYRLIGCDLVQIVPMKLPKRDYLCVDEEGRLKEQDTAFSFDGWVEPYLVGNALVCNDGKDGVKATVAEIEARVRFLVRA